MAKFSGVCPLHKEYLDENGDCYLCQHSGIKSIRCSIKEIDFAVAEMIQKGYIFDAKTSHAILIFEDKQQED